MPETFHIWCKYLHTYLYTHTIIYKMTVQKLNIVLYMVLIMILRFLIMTCL